MTKQQYSEVLRDPRWQKKRLEILNRDGWSCQKCGSAKDALHVHHREYKAGRLPWDYPGELLITLCQKCHEKEESDALDPADMLFSFHYVGMFNSEIRAEFNKIIEARLKLKKNG
jgi:5-methylcytosine-specific restriction endonuclease McrA